MAGITAFGVPSLPKWLTFIRVFAIVLSVGVLASQAYSITIDVKPGDGAKQRFIGPQGMLIFDSSWTILTLTVMLVLERLNNQRLYYRLAFAVALVLNSLFWLTGFMWEANWTVQWFAMRNVLKDPVNQDKLDEGVLPAVSSFCATLAAGTALGAIAWVVVLVIGVVFIRHCFKDGTQKEEEGVGEMYGAYGGGRSWADPAVEMQPPPRYS